jgi:N-acetylglucosaminylphosphatidylinositol deacetylase
MGFLLFTLLPFLFLAIWISLAQLVNVYLPSLHHKRVGILIAHPDDEAMFFSPTVIALTNPVLKNHVKILCLCRGRLRTIGVYSSDP